MNSPSPALETVTGARQTLTVVFPIWLNRTPGWDEGPFPFELGNQRADAAARCTYFAPAPARILYGAPGRPCRWHRTVSVDHGGLRLHGMEILRTPTVHGAQKALAVLHLTVQGPMLPVLRAIDGRPTAGPDPLAGPLSPTALLGDLAQVRINPQTFGLWRPYTIVFLTPEAAHTPALRPTPETLLPPSADAWLWQLASRSSPEDFPPPPETAAKLTEDTVRISGDWSALVLRYGAAFLGHRPDTGPGDFYDHAQFHARTLYLDSLLLGTLQRNHIEELTDELSGVFEGPQLAARVASLERNIAVFRSTYWREYLTAHGPANDLVSAFQAQHRLVERFWDILAEAADYNRLIQAQESRQVSGALGILTILGLPLGTALGILQVLGDDSLLHLVIALLVSIAATALTLATPYGRLVLSSLSTTTSRDHR